ncbi:hypothetical protein Tco_0233548 [Tanacetum coccineum]
MSSGSQSVGDAIIPKFDMHVNPSVLSSDEVNSLVAEYVIPSDLHPCVPPSGLTMNRLSADKIDSSVADPPSTSVRAANICRLCEHVVDLHPVHPAMLYAIGLTTIWKYVGHHPVFKDGEGNGNLLPSWLNSLSFLWPEVFVLVVEVENERVLAAKRKTQAAKDKAVAERASRPLSFALDDTEEDHSIHTGFGILHSASPLNTIIPDQTNPALGGGDLASESARHEEDDTDHHFDSVDDGTEANSPPAVHHSESQHSIHSAEDTPVHSGGPQHDERDGRGHQHASGSSGSSLRGDAAQLSLFVPTWKLTTNSILNDAESYRDMMALQRAWFELGRGAITQIDLLQRYESLSDDYSNLYDTHRSCETVSDRLTNTKNQLVDAVRGRNKLADDHKSLQQEHLGCADKEATLVEKLAVAEKEKYDLLDKNQEQEERIK